MKCSFKGLAFQSIPLLKVAISKAPSSHRSDRHSLAELGSAGGVKPAGQNKESCVVYGMPRAAEKAGVVDKEADLEEIAGLLIAALQQNGG